MFLFFVAANIWFNVKSIKVYLTLFEATVVIVVVVVKGVVVVVILVLVLVLVIVATLLIVADPIISNVPLGLLKDSVDFLWVGGVGWGVVCKVIFISNPTLVEYFGQKEFESKKTQSFFLLEFLLPPMTACNPYFLFQTHIRLIMWPSFAGSATIAYTS